MRVSFDSNAWEAVFDPADQTCAPIRAALATGVLRGFICEAGFRIEAIRKPNRATYFTQSQIGFRFDGVVEHDGQPCLKWSLGPKDYRHPGLPAAQAEKLQQAFGAGIRLMRGLSWLGLPGVAALRIPALFDPETPDAFQAREQKQLDAAHAIDERGVGHAAFLAADGWSPAGRGPEDGRRFRKACAEWADGELVAAHIAYGHDILCTNDRAQGAGTSVFDATNRTWLSANYGVIFKTVAELLADLSAGGHASRLGRRLS